MRGVGAWPSGYTGRMATKTRVSLEQFLAMPETEPPSELVDGEVIQKMSPNLYHARLTSRLIILVGNYVIESGEGTILNELRHVDREERRVFLPDINVTLNGRLPKGPEAGQHGAIAVQPDFAIEVLSPGESTGRTLERADFYMRAGTRLLWLVDPEIEAITAYRPGQAPTVHRAPAVIDAQPVLRDFTLDVAKLFAVLTEDDDEE